MAWAGPTRWGACFLQRFDAVLTLLGIIVGVALIVAMFTMLSTCTTVVSLLLIISIMTFVLVVLYALKRLLSSASV